MDMQDHAIFAEQVDHLRFLAWFRPSGGGAEVVRNDLGEPEVFNSRAEAMAHAGLCLSQRLDPASTAAHEH